MSGAIALTHLQLMGRGRDRNLNKKPSIGSSLFHASAGAPAVPNPRSIVVSPQWSDSMLNWDRRSGLGVVRDWVAGPERWLWELASVSEVKTKNREVSKAVVFSVNRW